MLSSESIVVFQEIFCLLIPLPGCLSEPFFRFCTIAFGHKVVGAGVIGVPHNELARFISAFGCKEVPVESQRIILLHACAVQITPCHIVLRLHFQKPNDRSPRCLQRPEYAFPPTPNRLLPTVPRTHRHLGFYMSSQLV